MDPLPTFSPAVAESWALPTADEIGRIDEDARSGVLVRIDRAREEAVSYLRLVGGSGALVLSAAGAEALSVEGGERLAPAEVEQRIHRAGIPMHDPDRVHHLPLDVHAEVRAERPLAGVRRLTADDADLFASFVAEAPPDDLDDAFVELDHWLVAGAVRDGRLVSVASMYPWRGTGTADLGVITLPDSRGRGLARATVRAISALALQQGYEPQYRCQLDNAASLALARGSGFRALGDWSVSRPTA